MELQGNQNLINDTEMLQRMCKFLEFLPGSVSEKLLFFLFDVKQEEFSESEETGLKSAT